MLTFLLSLLGIVLIGVGVVIDVGSFVLGVRRVIHMRGPSGVPVVAMGFYVLGSLFVGMHYGRNVGWPLGLGCAVFHVLFQFLLLLPIKLIAKSSRTHDSQGKDVRGA